jgi:hypothetical protein
MENMTKSGNLMFDVYFDSPVMPISFALMAVSVEQVADENENRFGTSKSIDSCVDIDCLINRLRIANLKWWLISLFLSVFLSLYLSFSFSSCFTLQIQVEKDEQKDQIRRRTGQV